MTYLRVAGALLCLAAAPLVFWWAVIGAAAFVFAIMADDFEKEAAQS